jgi:hypothetical protein
MKKSIRILSAAGGLLLTLAVSTSALAQDTPPAASPPPAVVTSSGSGSGAGIGVGAAAFLSGLTGIQVVYDTRPFHVEGIFGFNSVNTGGPMDTRQTNFQFGARGWYHLHMGSNSDFSLGGGAGVIAVSGGGSPTAMLLEPGMLARVFLTANFALHVTAGVSMRFGDEIGPTTNPGFGLSSQFLGGFGFSYFFR